MLIVPWNVALIIGCTSWGARKLNRQNAFNPVWDRSVEPIKGPTISVRLMEVQTLFLKKVELSESAPRIAQEHFTFGESHECHSGSPLGADRCRGIPVRSCRLRHLLTPAADRDARRHSRRCETHEYPGLYRCSTVLVRDGVLLHAMVRKANRISVRPARHTCRCGWHTSVRDYVGRHHRITGTASPVRRCSCSEGTQRNNGWPCCRKAKATRPSGRRSTGGRLTRMAFERSCKACDWPGKKLPAPQS